MFPLRGERRRGRDGNVDGVRSRRNRAGLAKPGQQAIALMVVVDETAMGVEGDTASTRRRRRSFVV